MSDESGRKKLPTIQEEKDLGVLVKSDLKPSTQCVQVATKARKITGMTRRNFGRQDKTDFLIIYKTYIRPHLKYCNWAWSPHLVKDIKVIEKVQRAATKLVPELRKLDYNEKLKRLDLITLQ